MAKKKQKKSFFDVSSLDIFGDPVSLKFEGQKTFNTKCGGILTMMFILQVLYVVALKMKSTALMHEAGQLTTQTNLQLSQDELQDDSIDLKELDFRVGFVKSRQALKEPSIDFSPAIGAFELVRVSYRTADQEEPDF